MKIGKRHLLWILIILLAGSVALVLFGGNATGQYDDFAKCLAEKDAKMYGAYWCGHCANQKKEFGASWKYVDYVECSLPNKAGQTQICEQAGIKGYPTWEFSDGSRLEGEVSLYGLAQKTGCELV
ncbi:MAG: hypothetical protein HY516_04080 [Candidatus Aenigmarchaeota archaeon]|nr:hypothetical protein [Candidatus Aenigmarchaeota archaeon]